MATPANECVVIDFVGPSSSNDISATRVTSSAPVSEPATAAVSFAPAPGFVRDEAYRAEKKARKIAKYSQVKKRNSKKNGARLKKQQKAALFLKWLVDTFGLKGQARYACIKCETLKAQQQQTRSGQPAIVSASTPTTHNAKALSVIDVAGGRGQLAFYLAAFYQIPVSVIDPAPMNLKRFEDLYAKKQESVVRIVKQQRLDGASPAATSSGDDDICLVCNQPVPIVPPSSPTPPIDSSSSILPNLHSPAVWLPHLRHFQCMFPSSIALVTYKAHEKPKFSGPDSDDEDEHLEDEEHAEACSFQHSSASNTGANFEVYDALLHSSLQSASLIYGMHADGATEALVDYALEHKKDFAVVPCCVFPNAAPHRSVKRSLVGPPSQASRKPRAVSSMDVDTSTEVPNSTSAVASNSSTSSSDSLSSNELIPVRTYEEFLAYLQAKHPAIQRVDLPFEGRNTVLFMRRESC